MNIDHLEPLPKKKKPRHKKRDLYMSLLGPSSKKVCFFQGLFFLGVRTCQTGRCRKKEAKRAEAVDKTLNKSLEQKEKLFGFFPSFILKGFSADE